ncbi:MAG: type IV toxin-antitoxin system AbiEi family antitoxin [bacterium]
MKVQTATEYIRSLLQRGRYTFTINEAEQALGGRRKALDVLLRQQTAGWLFVPTRGFYVIIDPQHQAQGILPLEWYIDDWATSLQCNYYIGGLSAAMLHGASHQKPQQQQVIIDRQLPPITHNMHRVLLFYKKTIPQGAWEQRKSSAGYYHLSTPAMTAYDILRYPKACPSLDLAATVLTELGEVINAEVLAQLLDFAGKIAVLQRLGWLLDHVGWDAITHQLSERLQQQRLVWRPLRKDMPIDGSVRDKKWHIIENAEVDADI